MSQKPPQSVPTGICVHCKGIGECHVCTNDAYCTKCDHNPKRIAGNSVPFIVKTDSFVSASKKGVHEPCNQNIVLKEGRIKSTQLNPHRFNLMRSSLVNVFTIDGPADKKGALDKYYTVSKSGSLGKGSYGTVSKVKCIYSDNVRALKTVLKSKIENITRLKREILIMKRLDHPGIIRLHEVFEDSVNLYLVMELCTGGELFDRVIRAQKFSEQYSARLIKQVFSVLAYCHSNDIIHRDLKPENLLYIDSSPNSKIKVIDWGFALKCDRSHTLSSVVGTPYYVAPEILHGKYSATICDADGNDNKEILKKVKHGEFQFESKHWSQRSKSVKHLITRLLTYNPADRITAKEALLDDWVQFFDKVKYNTTEGTLTYNPDRLSPRLATELLNRFVSFVQMNPIKRIAVTATAYMLGGKDLGHSTVIFNALDKNCDGVLTASELIDTFSGLGMPTSELEEVLSLMDTDGNGTIDYTEFLAATMDRNLYGTEKLAKVAYRVFDVRREGLVTIEDLMEVLSVNAGRVSFTKENVTSTPGILTFAEFWTLLKTPEPTKKSISKTALYHSGTSPKSTSIVQTPTVPRPPPTIISRSTIEESRTIPANPEPTKKNSPIISTYNKARGLMKNRSSKTHGI